MKWPTFTTHATLSQNILRFYRLFFLFFKKKKKSFLNLKGTLIGIYIYTSDHRY